LATRSPHKTHKVKDENVLTIFTAKWFYVIVGRLEEEAPKKASSANFMSVSSHCPKALHFPKLGLGQKRAAKKLAEASWFNVITINVGLSSRVHVRVVNHGPALQTVCSGVL
jgi:hypothetical protein